MGTEWTIKKVKERNLCVNCGLCKYGVLSCPGKGADLSKLQKMTFKDSARNPLIGSYKKIFVGYSKCKKIFDASASGGIVTTILFTALSARTVDLVVTGGKVIRTLNELLNNAGSIYSLGPNLKALSSISKDENFALVGLPCQIHAVRMAQSQGFFKNLKFCVSLFCGANLKAGAVSCLARHLKIDKKNIFKIKYRARGWPGGLEVTLRDRSVKFLPKHEYNILFDFPHNRCALCIDHTGEFADISVGDAWIPELVACSQCGKWFCTEHSSHSCIDKRAIVIVRTKNGLDQIKKANLKLNEAHIEQVLRSQLSGIERKKRDAFIKLGLLRLLKKVPEYNIVRPTGEYFLKRYNKAVNLRINMFDVLVNIVDLFFGKVMSEDYKILKIPLSLQTLRILSLYKVLPRVWRKLV